MTEALVTNLRDARRRTLALVDDLTDDQLVVQYAPNVNPFLWELGHVAFFWDAFVRGYAWGEPRILAGSERLYDSFKVDHEDRWDLPLPSRAETLDYMCRVSGAVEDGAVDGCDRSRYCIELATLHEDMHGEAFAYMRQYLGYRVPGVGEQPEAAAGAWPGDVELAGGTFCLGADPGDPGFAFDNEKWGHEVEVAPFRIAKAPVTNAEYLEFVEDGGYAREELWSFQGWVWRARNEIAAPGGWSREGHDWHRRRFDRVEPLPPHQPVVHVSHHEAEAFCAWAGRRLPTEAEWEMAASFDPRTGMKSRFPWGEGEWHPGRANLDYTRSGYLDVADLPNGDSPSGCRQMLGNVWEWTASAFYPFPGYLVDLPYREYSAPWFGTRTVLRGGAFASRTRMVHNMFRNFFTPDRRDIFAGFRTCARGM